MAEAKEKNILPQRMEDYNIYVTNNTCCVTGSPLNGRGYAKNQDEGRAGIVYSVAGLFKRNLIDELSFAVHCGLDQKIIDKLSNKNIILVSQLKKFLEINQDTGLTKKELEEAAKILNLEVK